MSSAPNKKRKRGADNTDGSEGSGRTFTASSLPATQLGPVLVSFPAVRPPQNIGFNVYLEPKKNEPETSFVDLAAILTGEADTVDFTTAVQVDRQSTGCSYYVAVHNKRTKTTVLRPAPTHILQREPKALKGIPPAAVSAADRIAARAALGAVFGTKKAQAALRATERNKVDVTAMEGVVGHLQDRIAANTGVLPTQDEAKASADAARLIPEHDPDAADPSGVYPLHNIIPEAEFSALSVSRLLAAKTDFERLALLPHSRSSWVQQHLALTFASPKPRKEHIKCLVYVAALFAFKYSWRLLGDTDKLHERLSSLPGIVVDGLVERFTESSRGSSHAQATSATETKLLTHLFALCLRLDDYATDTSLLASDLSMTIPAVNTLFKTLGCTMTKLSPADLKRLGLPDSAAHTKRAVLKVPLTFPKARFGKKKGRGP